MSSALETNPSNTEPGTAADHAAHAFTWMFVPGNRPDRFEKAADSGADAVIIDLEDAVAPDDKPSARADALKYVSSKPAYIRINGSTTEFFDDDVEAVAAAGDQLRGIMLPKSEDPEQFANLARRLPDDTVVIALIETPAGILGAAAIAQSPRVARLAFGNADFMLDTEIEDESLGLLFARSQLVLASRAAGLGGPIDGITTSLDDPRRVSEDAEHGRRLGFTGKLCIHPKQIQPSEQGFAPSAADTSWAKRVVDAAGSSEGAAVRVDGEMIDRPRLERAQLICKRHRRFSPNSKNGEG